MRRKRQLLSPNEVAELERQVGYEPTALEHTIVIRRERARWVESLRRLPDGARVTLALCTVALVLAVIACGFITLLSVLPSSPPPGCVKHGGVFKAMAGNSGTEWSGMVVCRDGTSYTN